MIKYGNGLPINISGKYFWYIDLDTDTLYKRVNNVWVVVPDETYGD